MTLTELSYQVRKLLPFLVLFILVFLIIFYSFKLLFVYLEANQAKPPIVPTLFGKIDVPTVNEATSSANFKFTLDTIEGHPVTTTDSAKVFFLPKPATRFGYREKIYLMAQALGYDTQVTDYKLNGNLAVFDDGIHVLTINIGNFNFTYESKPDSSTLASSGTYIPSQTDVQNKAIDFLKGVGRYPEELATGTTNIIYLKYDPGLDTYTNVDNQYSANLVEVDFYRQNVDGIPVATPRFFTSQNYVIMQFNKDGYQVVKAQVAFFEKSDTQVDLYPVKTADVAWQELLDGKGIVVAATKGVRQISIKQMSIYYFDPDVYQSYLEPVYVFIGDNDFVAFVPAVTDQYLIGN
ncbi:hypothetical protein M1328_02640 [Patescibacteria group bacterium]|nr:hypothetical protein [Patescibacteria group bacterium]